MARSVWAVAAALLLTGTASAGVTTVTITSHPPTKSPSDSATFAFTVDPPQSLYCFLDGAQNPATGPCKSPTTYSALAPGKHLFRVAQASAGDVGEPVSDSWEWVVLAAGPDTTITSGPSGPVSSRSATFTFVSDTRGATFECSLDDSGFAACLSGQTYRSLALGRHTFAVRAVTDSETDTTPATQSWTISATPQPPDTQLTAAPSGTVRSRAATFRFVSIPAGAAFQCALDGAAYLTCGSGQTYSSLASGVHTFSVRAVLDGLVDATPAYRQWSVSSTPARPPDTMITQAPGAKTSARRVTLAYRSVPAGASFECSLDGEAFHACAATTATARLSLGEHRFLVRAVRAGAADPTPAAATWRVVRRRSAAWATVGGGIGAAALLVAGGGVLFRRRRVRLRLGLRPFELEASDEEPPRTCRVPQGHTWRRDCKLKPALRKIEALTMSADGLEPERITGEPVEQLNRAVRARRLHRRRQVGALATEVAWDLLERTGRWAGDGSAEVELEAEVTGGKLECEFRRYECVPRESGSAWQEVQKWRGESEHTATVPVVHLHWPPGRETFVALVAPALVELVRRVDVPRRHPAPEAPPVLHP